MQCLKSSVVKILEEAHTLWNIEALLFTDVPFFLLGLFLVYVILVGTARCGGSGTCLENVLADNLRPYQITR